MNSLIQNLLALVFLGTLGFGALVMWLGGKV